MNVVDPEPGGLSVQFIQMMMGTPFWFTVSLLRPLCEQLFHISFREYSSFAHMLTDVSLARELT